MSKRLKRIKKRSVKLREKYKNEIGIISALKMVFYSFKRLHFVTIFPPYTENSVIFTGNLQAVELSSPFTVLE